MSTSNPIAFINNEVTHLSEAYSAWKTAKGTQDQINLQTEKFLVAIVRDVALVAAAVLASVALVTFASSSAIAFSAYVVGSTIAYDIYETSCSYEKELSTLSSLSEWARFILLAPRAIFGKFNGDTTDGTLIKKLTDNTIVLTYIAKAIF